MAETTSNFDQDHEGPLREDIRLLGRILGDIVREQEGEEVFAIVERIRQTSVRFHRDHDTPARRELEAILDASPTIRRPRSSALSAASRISPISPRISITSVAHGPMLWLTLRPTGSRSRTCFAAAKRPA